MKVREFILHKTNALELCVICDCGWPVETVWVDYEDLFVISDKYSEKKVKKDYWGTLPIVDSNNNKTEIKCHFIEV